MQHVAPYSELADIYDKVMSHIGYDVWIDFLKELCMKHSIEPVSTLDLSCGTGKTLAYMSEGFGKIYCTDLSFSMLKILRKNYPAYADKTFLSDMADLPINTSFDLILNIQDSFNYFSDHNLIKNHFIEIYQNLNMSGAYIFDFSTEENIKNNFLDLHEYYEDECYGYERLNSYLKKKKINVTEFYIWKEESGERRNYYEKHIQRMYTVNEVEQFLKASPFQEWSFYEDETLHSPGKDAERIHVIARKNSG